MPNYTVGATNCKWLKNQEVITAHKRSLQRLCFYGLCPAGGLGLYPGGSLSRRGSVQGVLCPGGLCLGFSVQGGLSVQGGSLSGGSLCRQGGLCTGRGSLSRQGGLCPGRGVSVQGVSVGETPHTLTSGRYASYWNAFLFRRNFTTACLDIITAASSSERAEEVITYSIAGIYVKQYCQLQLQLFANFVLLKLQPRVGA